MRLQTDYNDRGRIRGSNPGHDKKREKPRKAISRELGNVETRETYQREANR